MIRIFISECSNFQHPDFIVKLAKLGNQSFNGICCIKVYLYTFFSLGMRCSVSPSNEFLERKKKNLTNAVPHTVSLCLSTVPLMQKSITL